MVEQKKAAFQKFTPSVVDYKPTMALGHDAETGKAYYAADEVDQFIADMQAELDASKITLAQEHEQRMALLSLKDTDEWRTGVKVGGYLATVEALRREIKELRTEILRSHPSGEAEGAKPLEVLRTLTREWETELMRGPVQEVEFADGNALRKIVFETGEPYVGIPDGYCVADDGKPTYSDLEDELSALRAAVWPVVEWWAAYKPHHQGFEVKGAVMSGTKVLGVITATQLDELARLVGDADSLRGTGAVKHEPGCNHFLPDGKCDCGAVLRLSEKPSSQDADKEPERAGSLDRQLSAAELIGELVRIGNMAAPVWIDGIGALTGVSDDLGEEVILRGSDLGVADEKGA